MAKLAEKAKTQENTGSDAGPAEGEEPIVAGGEEPRAWSKHKPKRLLRTIISSMKNSRQFGEQMAREAKRRQFPEAPRKAFVADGLSCNWSIHAAHFSDYTPILDFVHAVSYRYPAALSCFGKCETAWSAYTGWMTSTWQGRVADVIQQLREQQQQLGLPPDDASKFCTSAASFAILMHPAACGGSMSATCISRNFQGKTDVQCLSPNSDLTRKMPYIRTLLQ